MWAIPDKYITKCYLKDTGELVTEHVYEAINKDEAETRAFLNCIIANNRKTNVRVDVKKL